MRGKIWFWCRKTNFPPGVLASKFLAHLEKKKTSSTWAGKSVCPIYVDRFRLLRNGITFRCESSEDQASWVDYLNGRSYLSGKHRVILHASSSHIVMSSNHIFQFLMGRARGQARMKEEKRALQGQSVARTHSVGGARQQSPGRLGQKDSGGEGAGKGKGKGKGKGFQPGCLNCGQMDHWARNCPQKSAKPQATPPTPEVPAT